MLFRNIVFSAALVGIIAGMFSSAFQQWQLSPIIQAAEQYEITPTAADSTAQYTPRSSILATWSPPDGGQRLFATVIANMLIGIGFALLLIGFMALHNFKANRPKVNWKSGLCWGTALLCVIFIAPAVFGLPPEIPGTVTESLSHRQSGWLKIAACTAIGIALLYYTPPAFKVAGLVLITLPHFIGVPKPASHTYLDTAAVADLNALTQQFIILSAIGSAIFCLLLGALSAHFCSKYVRLDSLSD